jgi:hypothetical protein
LKLQLWLYVLLEFQMTNSLEMQYFQLFITIFFINFHLLSNNKWLRKDILRASKNIHHYCNKIDF